MDRHSMVAYVLSRKFPVIKERSIELEWIKDLEAHLVSNKTISSLSAFDLFDIRFIDEVYQGQDEDNDLTDDDGDLHLWAAENLKRWCSAVTGTANYFDNCDTQEITDAYAFERKIEEAERRKSAELADTSSFVSSPSSVADMEYWLQLDSWSLDEATALSFVRDPRSVNDSTIDDLDEFSPFRNAFEERKQMIERAIAAGKFHEAIDPAKFMQWCKKKSLIEGMKDEWVGRKHSSSPGEVRKSNSLLRIVGFMLIDKYSVDTTSSNHAISRATLDEIIKRAAALGAHVLEEKQLKTRLEEAVRLVKSSIRIRP